MSRALQRLIATQHPARQRTPVSQSPPATWHRGVNATGGGGPITSVFLDGGPAAILVSNPAQITGSILSGVTLVVANNQVIVVLADG